MCPCKHVVDDGHELHDSLIQMEVLKAFEEVGVLAAVRPNHGDLFGFCFGWEDSYLKLEGL